MEDDEDDIYGSAPAANGSEHFSAATNGNAPIKNEAADEGMQDDGEEEEEEEDSDSDIDIITERKDAPAQLSQDFQKVKQEPVRISSAAEPAPNRARQGTPIKSETKVVGGKLAVRDGSKYPEYRSSTIDLNNTPMYDPAGKPITEIDLDADVAMEIKPWRVPGTDPTDFFNYGFDEFTWVQYCMKQNDMRNSVNGLKNEHKQFEAMFGGNQAPAMPAGMPGMPDMNPEMMNQMMQSMQSQGMDPSHMDFGAFMQQMQQMGMPVMPGGMAGFGQGQQGQGQGFNNFGGPQSGPNQGGQGVGMQPQSYDGYSPQQIAMLQQQQGGGGGGGGGGGRGRGRGRRW